MKKLILVLIIGMMGVKAYGQIMFQKAFGGTDSYGGYYVQQTTDGGYIIVGEDFYSANIYLIKTNVYGDTLWTKFIVTLGGAEGNCVRQTNDGGYIIVGGNTADGNDANYVYLIKTNSIGDTLWTKELGKGVGNSIQQTTDGGYIIGGYMSTCNAGCAHFFNFIKTDNLGNMVWTRIFEAFDNDDALSVQQTTDGGYMLAGFCESDALNNSFDHFYLIKTNSNGDTLWTKSYGGTRDIGYSAQQTTDGGYIIAGTTTSFGDSTGNVYLIKTDSIGDIVWSKTYGDSTGDIAYFVQQTYDGGYIIAGNTNNIYDTLGDVYLIKTNSIGDTLWTRTYGGSGNDVASSIQQTTDGGYIITGYTNSFGLADYALYLIKTDSNGNAGCYEGRTSTIVATPPTQIFPVTTIVSSGFTNYSLPTYYVGYAGGTVTTICTDEVINEISTNNFLSLYPNPTSGTFTLTYNFQLSTINSQLKIYDVLGQQVYSQPIVNQQSTIINLPQLSNGVYFYQLTNGTESYRGKFVKTNW